MAEKKYKVSVEKLCKKLTELTGGSSTDYTGTYCQIIPSNKFTIYGSTKQKLEEILKDEEAYKKCEVYFDIILKRADIVPYGMERHDEKNCGFEFRFNNVPFRSDNKLSDGTHLYDYIEYMGSHGYISSLNESLYVLSEELTVRFNGFITFKEIPANLLTITLKQEGTG